MKDLKQEYNELKKKYALPSYEDLNKEFEILYVTDIKEVEFILRFVRRRINDKIVVICNMLQTLLQPSPGSFINLQESSFLAKEEKQKYSTMLKDLMEVERSSFVSDFQGDEKKDAEFIKDIWKKWPSWKEETIALAKKIVEGWKNLEMKEEKQERYFI